MIKKIESPMDALEALNDNYLSLLNGKRKVPIVKEVNNTIGKMIDIHKLEAVSKSLSRDSTPLAWFQVANTGITDGQRAVE